MPKLLPLLALPLLLSLGPPGSPRAEIAGVLDDLHAAASRGDGEHYFELFAPAAVFIGTDATERWTLSEFRAYAMARFDEGRSWTYRPVERNVFVSPDGVTGWFDELLSNEKYGTCRGTGVLVKIDGRWRITQYHLTIPIPNEIAGAVVEMIRAVGEGQEVLSKD